MTAEMDSPEIDIATIPAAWMFRWSPNTMQDDDQKGADEADAVILALEWWTTQPQKEPYTVHCE
jgi:hypothetical protein